MTRNPRNLHRALHLVTLVEYCMVLRNYEMGVLDGIRQEADDVLNTTLVLVSLERPIPLVKPQCRESLDLDLIALLLKVYAIDPQELHLDITVAITILKIHLLIDLVGCFHPSRIKISTMAAPICIKVYKSEVVEPYNTVEIIVLELVARSRPV